MEKQNGVEIFKNGEQPPIPEGLKTDFEVISRFGFKIVNFEGRLVWKAATEEDYRSSEAKRLNIAPTDVEPKDYDCNQIGPRQCSGTCQGTHPKLWCSLVYNPEEKY